MQKKLVYALLSMLLMTSLSLSNDDVNESLKQSMNLGFVNTTGNTDTLNLNVKYEMSHTTVGVNNKPLKITFDTAVFVTENNEIKENEEFTLNLALEQEIAEDWLGYLSLNGLKNEFKNYDSKVSFGLGVGKKFYADEDASLSLKLGIAQNREDYANAQVSKRYTSLNQYIEYKHKFNDISKLHVKVGANQNFDDFEVLSVVGFNFTVAKDFSVTIEEEIRYDNIPPIGFEKTDTKTIVRVGYNF